MSAGAVIAMLVVIEGALVLAAIRYMVQGIRAAEAPPRQTFAGSGLSLPNPREGSPLEEDRASASS
jgi:hypothetical protein